MHCKPKKIDYQYQWRLIKIVQVPVSTQSSSTHSAHLIPTLPPLPTLLLSTLFTYSAPLSTVPHLCQCLRNTLTAQTWQQQHWGQPTVETVERVEQPLAGSSGWRGLGWSCGTLPKCLSRSRVAVLALSQLSIHKRLWSFLRFLIYAHEFTSKCQQLERCKNARSRGAGEGGVWSVGSGSFAAIWPPQIEC